MKPVYYPACMLVYDCVPVSVEPGEGVPQGVLSTPLSYLTLVASGGNAWGGETMGC